ncbi:SurA N-terminal domain-containing protein [Sphingobacterium oryzagri]|uniref:Periplasmic chaperone PpiD n=1 Tax=Sphingobacterium oryzagri TaxID=3025669 RepID=A0ABY7WIP9_9SPHI|nr:SurA N-terminal domain-containing protein [Sphingobacterium sp. KACC 22765]WDF68233.1 SurA N-terminal domain-containing protein [Sphingobacterium sp. KACC 22765]
MGLMSYLRNRAGLVVTIIGLAIVAFLLGDIINVGTPFWMKSQNQVGNVNGESIDYQAFNAQVDQTTAMYQQQMGGAASPQIRNYAVQQVWNQFVSQELLKQEIEKLGLTVGKDELNSLVTGTNPSPQIVQAFTSPETGTFDKNQLMTFISQVNTQGTPEMQAQWNALLENIRNERLNQKYSNLLSNSVYVTSLEAQDEYNNRNKLANFKYLLLDYSSIKDGEIKLTDSDYKAYYDAHKNTFKNPEESRTVEYVLFDATPTANDTAATKSTIEQLKAELVASKTDSLFAAVNSDTKHPFTYIRKGQVSPALDSVIFNAAVGTTVGPFLSNGVFEIAKVVDSKFSPDSVQASHILLNATAEGGVDKAKVKADSIKGLIQKGESFAALAVQFSVDQGSKVNGGDLGTFPRGQMVPEFDEAVFGGKAGDVIIVNSRYGTHIIKIEKQIGNSKIVKAAIVDKAINSGKATTEAAYTKANNFFGDANDKNFTEIASKQGVNVQKVDRVVAMDNNFNGVEVPRDLIRWIFEAKKGAITEKVFDTEQNFIIARVVDVQPKGNLSLEAVKPHIEAQVKNEVKAKMLTEKMNNALNGSSSIDQAAQKLSKTAVAVENIVLANPVLPGIALEPSVVGTAFGLQPNKLSKTVKGTQGVYAVQVTGFVNPAELVASDMANQKKQLLGSKTQRAWASIYQALQNKADIDDNRIRFY